MKERTAVRRRAILKGVGTVAGVGILPTVSGRPDNASGSPGRSLTRDDFEVVGTKRTKTRFEPGTITIETTYRSKDLKKRYGMTPPKITKEEVIDRAEIPDEEDTYPERKVFTTKQKWKSHYAKEEEWKEVIKNRRTGESGGVGALHDHPPEDQGNCGRAVWNYEKLDENGYEESAPINLVLYGVGMEHVETVLEDHNDWVNLENTWIPREGDRYAWDMDRTKFVGPEEEPHGEYGGWGTKKFGRNGRHHVRCYELEPGVVSIQAHEDGDWELSKRAHDVVSYQSTREKMIDLFTNNWPYLVERGTVDSGPDGWGNDGADDNHDGKAVQLKAWPWEAPKPADIDC